MDNKTLAAAVVLTGGTVMFVGLAVLFRGGPPPAPSRPKPPPTPEALMNSTLKYSQVVYHALIEQDAKFFKVQPPTLKEIAESNPYYEEWNGHRKMAPGHKMETAHFKLTVLVTKEKGYVAGQEYSADHLSLRIENLTDKYLAYRIETAVADSKRCATKGSVAHNAIAIEPKQTISRTECLYHARDTLDIKHVEVIEMPALSAMYVSRLQPQLVLYDTRTTTGHLTPQGRGCPQTFSWREIRDGAERREFGWRDVMDFYARHNCDEYSFFKSYRYRVPDSDEPLPARPLTAE